MLMHLKGVHRVAKPLKDGRLAVYYYAWRGGPALTGEPGTPAFIDSYQRAHESRKAVPQGTILSLVAHYKQTEDFTGLGASTKRDYLRYLEDIEIEFGKMPIAAVEDRRSRGDFKKWRDGMAETPRKADMAWSVLQRVLSVAKDRGLISVNVCERPGRLYKSNRRDKIWDDKTIARAERLLPPHLTQALTLALWTGQRQGDLLRLPWSAYDGQKIRLKQSKRDAAVLLKVGSPLKTMLDEMERVSPVILTNTRGVPWTSDGFRSSWRKGCAKAEIDGLTFHDLRGSVVTRLALAGNDVPAITSVTGHSLKEAAAILQSTYLSRSQQLSEDAVTRLEGRFGERKL